MAKLEASVIEKYQLILAKDPNSQVFAPLAEAYREMGLIKEATQIVTAGVQRHPQFVGGLVTYARIFREIGKTDAALEALKKATALSPENILAHQLTAEIELSNRNAKGALKAFKMVLFLNPTSKSAQKAIQKLESFTADEYDDDVFSMAQLPKVNLDTPPPEKKIITETVTSAKSLEGRPQEQRPREKALERIVSLIDAFIVRNDLEKAQILLNDSRKQFGDHPEIAKRTKSLQLRFNETDEPPTLKPLRTREELIQEKQLKTLRLMLRKIEDYPSQG